MKIFLDTADVEAIRKGCETGLIDGVTTNPTHVAKTGRPFLRVVEEICAIVPGPVSVEAVGDMAEELIAEAQSIARLAPNIVIKIPMTVEGLVAVPVLEREKNVKTNVTMIFSPTQALLAMKAGASYISIVLSRLDACAHESDVLVVDTVTIKHNYGFSSEIIAGSVKTQNHLLTCLRAGLDIATIPDSLFFQMYNHPLTDAGIEQFILDWKKVLME